MRKVREPTRRNSVFSEQLSEGGDGNIENIFAVILSRRLDVLVRGETSRALEFRQCRRGIARVGDTREGAGVGGIDVFVTLIREVNQW